MKWWGRQWGQMKLAEKEGLESGLAGRHIACQVGSQLQIQRYSTRERCWVARSKVEQGETQLACDSVQLEGLPWSHLTVSTLSSHG